MKLKVGKGGTGGKVRSGKDMEVGANDEEKEDEEMAEELEKGEEGKVVFRRRTQN